MSKVLNHIHQYERSRSNKSIYRCIHAQCSHYQRVDFLIGKESECPKCHETFIMTEKQLIKMKVKMPVCLGCSNAKGAADYRAAKKISEKMFERLNINQEVKELKQSLNINPLEDKIDKEEEKRKETRN